MISRSIMFMRSLLEWLKRSQSLHKCGHEVSISVRCHSCRLLLKISSQNMLWRYNFFVFSDDEHLLEPVNDSNIYRSGSGSTVLIPCIAKNPTVEVELRSVQSFAFDGSLVSASETTLQSVNKFFCQLLSHIADFNIQRPSSWLHRESMISILF